MLERTFHEPVKNETSKIPKMKQDLQDGKITVDEYNTKLKNLKDRLGKIVEKMNEMRDDFKKQDKNIESQSIKSSIAIKELEDNVEQLEHDNKHYLKETLRIKTKAHDNEYEIYGLKNKVEKHSLKLNASNGTSGGVWQLHSDTEIYPILKQDKINHWSKYNDNLKNIKLEGDSLIELQKFWNALDTAFTSTLNTNKGLGDYDKLQSTFSAWEVLVPSMEHTQRNQAIYTYENFTRALRDHLLKKETIDKGTSPKEYRCLTKN